jgi:dTDP-glucose 4,6-dehydratase/UDP-glucuronate decarboxylase
MNTITREDGKKILERVTLAPLKGKSVLITGANGLFGQYLAHAIALANEDGLNCTLDCVSLHGPTGSMKELVAEGRVNFKAMDLSSPFSPETAYDFIFHAAGYAQPAKFITDPLSTIALNVQATDQLLKVTRSSNGTLVFFSSIEVYGEIPKEEVPVKETYNGNCPTDGPRAVYREAKRLGEALCRSSFQMDHAHVKIVRIAHTYGPGISINDGRVLGNFLRKALVDKHIVLQDDGSARRTFGYVGDMVAFTLYIALHGKQMVYNVSGKDTVTIKELAEEIAKQSGVSVEVPAQGSQEQHIGTGANIDEVDISRILGEIGDFPLTSLKDGISRTIAWNRNEFNIT